MYHTEGFVNKYTMDFGKHIVMLSLEEGGGSWYVWCVVKKAIVDTDWLRQVLSFWLLLFLTSRVFFEPRCALLYVCRPAANQFSIISCRALIASDNEPNSSIKPTFTAI